MRASTLTLGNLCRLSCAAVLAAGLSGCAEQSAVAENEPAHLKDPAARKPAPEFELKDINSAPVKLSDYAGKVVLVNFWATWCGPCRAEMPWFAEFDRAYKDRGFAVLGVSLDEEGWDVVKPYLEEHPDIKYRIMIGTEETAQIYGGVESLPTSFMIDREGRIASIHTGLVSKSTYDKEINELLGGGIVQDASIRNVGAGAGAGELRLLRAN
jgi:thiol-disulfide isomerase/thioredoxin